MTLDLNLPGHSYARFYWDSILYRPLKNPPKIILTTSDPQFAIEAFEYDCIVDYLVKPIAVTSF